MQTEGRGGEYAGAGSAGSAPCLQLPGWALPGRGPGGQVECGCGCAPTAAWNFPPVTACGVLSGCVVTECEVRDCV